jgi:hypothetical protein
MRRFAIRSLVTIAIAACGICEAQADGKLVRPRSYEGSLEETAQEAILIFQAGDDTRSAREDMILKVSVKGGALTEFGWVIPFPAPPDIEREDAALFRELFNYVEARKARGHGKASEGTKSAGADASPRAVEVISRKTVGSYDTAVVRDKEGGLNDWLHSNGFQPLEDAEDVLGFYREKDYVFACIKVSDAALAEGKAVDLHPLRFSFDTGGRDGIYFPMKLTGLQSEPFDVNLYVFHRYWINDRLSRFGYEHRGFHLRYRDWDSPQCEPNGGKAWTLPESDPFLMAHASLFPKTTDLLRRLHPGEAYYLTDIQAQGLRPAEVRQWSDDLWLFPYYTNRDVVPYDALRGGVAAAAWPGLESPLTADAAPASRTIDWRTTGLLAAGIAIGIVAGGLAGVRLARSRRIEGLDLKPQS